MSEHDLLLGDTAAVIAAEQTGAHLELVADGVMWRGSPVAATTWAHGMAWRPDGRPPLRDLLAMSGYLHLDRACYRLGERWVPAGDVRLRLDSVSAWWLRGHATSPGPSALGAERRKAHEGSAQVIR